MNKNDEQEKLGDQYLRAPEYARIMGIEEYTARRWCNEGKVPGAFKVPGGRSWYIPKSVAAPEGSTLLTAEDMLTLEQMGSYREMFMGNIKGAAELKTALVEYRKKRAESTGTRGWL